MRIAGIQIQFLAWVLSFAAAASTFAAPPPVEDFCFLQISDMHINPRPVGSPEPSPTDRSVDAVSWFCREAGERQRIEPAGLTTPPPSFAIATGDLTEYGVIHTTWDIFEQHFAPLEIPLHLTPGNHDNTWTAMLAIMRDKHGGDHYSFDRFGCHFASIDTATPQEPVPSIDQRTITWLERDLAAVDPATPVFLFCHHPLSSGELAKPYEQLRLLETIRGHNVVCLLMGHGHRAAHERWAFLDSVMGGSTFGPRTGYNIIDVRDGTLRIAYRYRDGDKPMEMLLEKRIAPRPRPELAFEAGPVTAPAGEELLVSLRVTAPASWSRRKPPQRFTETLFVDRDEVRTIDHTAGEAGNASREWPVRQEHRVPTRGLAPGRHFVRSVMQIGRTELDAAREVLITDPTGGMQSTTIQLDAGMKAAPLLVGDDIIAATTAGTLVRCRFDGTPRTEQLFDAGAEILHAPALAGDTLYFCAAERGVHALSRNGKLLWRRPVDAVVYGTPALDDERLYVGDLEGAVHALDRKTGTVHWSQRHATFSIEQPLCLHDGVLYFGAWDGLVYAVNASDGSLRWKTRSPAGQSGGSFTSRYYAAADCATLVLGDRLFVTDRAYRLGSYSLDGEYLGDIAEGVAGIGALPQERGFLARGLERGLTCYDADGERLWSNDVELGRFPIPPTAAGDRVLVCSNHGRLTAHDAAGGRVLAAFQATPLLPVMAPVTVDARGHALVAGMDGSLTRVTVAP